MLTDIEKARSNMIEQQIRPWDVLDPNVLELFAEVRREQFVCEGYEHLAFVDMELPLPEGQVMLAPKVQARMLQELDLRPTDRVLEIGTGSGFMTALLAKISKEVLTVEKYESLAEMARRNLAEAGIRNVESLIGNGLVENARWVRAGFDAVVISGAVEQIPETLLECMNANGRMTAIVGTAPVMQAQLVERIVSGPGVSSYRSTGLFETLTKPLEDAPRISHFRF